MSDQNPNNETSPAAEGQNPAAPMNPTPAPATPPSQQPTQPIPQQPMQPPPPLQPGPYQGQYGQPGHYGQPGQYAQQGQYGQQGQPWQQPWGQPGPQQPWGQQPGQPGQQPMQPGAPAAFVSSPAPGDKHRWRRRTAAGIAALAIAGAAGLGGLAVGHATAGTGVANTPSASSPNQGGYQPGGGFNPDNGNGFNPDNGYGFIPNGGFGQDNGGSNSGTSTPATQKQQTGIVTINTVVDYGQARAAGTGMVLTSDGLVLTNHHVVDGSTQIEVTVETTGKTYQAEVVGTDATNDVAVLRLKDASNLTPATIDHDNNLKVGDTVTTVGNAEGRGDLVQASGPVTGLNQTISASNEGSGQGGETLTGLIQANVDVVSGDSGGAMLDSQGEVVGMTTAASTGGPDVTGYAININKALSIADQIESGHASDTVHIGPSAFLGVQLSGTDATIAGTVQDSPAARAGLQAGDTITEVDGNRVGSSEQLSSALAKHKPGDKVAITWTTADGTTRSATVTLVEGPVA